MRQVRRVGFGILMMLVIAVTGHAQTLGTINGVVKDTQGAVIPGVSVEVASPALIEKTRSVVTDERGQYTIIDLAVGTYSVTFALPGFATVKRDGVGVLANFTATINAELKVGGATETITVTGETPIIDTSGTITDRAVTPDLIKAIPNGDTMYQLAAMMPGVTISGGQDVGGSSGSPVGAQLSAHGGTGGDEIQLIDGVRIGNLIGGGSRTQETLSPLLYDEVDVQLSGQGGDAVRLGVTSNSIPRSGGNKFSGTFLMNGSAPSLQSNNLTSRLQALGLTSVTAIKTLYDINGSFGGPIIKDRLWFYGTERYQTNQTWAAGSYYDQNPLPTPTDLVRVATTQQGYNPNFIWDNTLRLTLAVTPKLKVNGFGIMQRKWWPYYPGVSAAVSPESVEQITWPGRLYQVSADYAASSRLIVEGGVNYQDSSDKWAPEPIANNAAGTAVRVTEQGTTLTNGTVIAPITYGPVAPNAAADNPMHMYDARGTVSYVTGTHNFKLGLDLQRGFRENYWWPLSSGVTTPIVYRTLGYVLNQITIYAPPGRYRSNMNYDAGIFAQDRWKIKRLTLTGGFRLDLQKESYSPTTLYPSQFVPNRPIQTIPGANVVNWRDTEPRFGAAYDLFGNGKTAVKASAARGVATDAIATAAALNPGSATAFALSTARTVANGDASNCNLLNPLANGNCGPWQTPAFGSATAIGQEDPHLLHGWNVRPWNWEFSTGVQQEITPHVSAGITYYRRINGGFTVIQNTDVAAVDYTQYHLTVPTDSRLPSSGQTLTFYDVNPGTTSLGFSPLATNNFTTSASKFGNQYQHWNGFDIVGSLRQFYGVTMNGGVTLGKQMADNCQIVQKLPALLGANPLQYCHWETGWEPRYKLLALYTLPWQNIRVSGNYQSLPGPYRQATVLYTQAQITSALGRPATVAGNKSFNVIPTNNAYGDRLNQFDLRFSRIFKFGERGTLDANFDIYNAFNSDAVLTENATYSGANGGAWLLPTSVIVGRIIKFGGRWDF
jgi:hypothetical protein